MKKRMCPNCGQFPVANHPDNGCVLTSLIYVLRDRGDHTKKQLRDLHAKADVDSLWTDVGKIVDQLGDGDYST